MDFLNSLTATIDENDEAIIKNVAVKREFGVQLTLLQKDTTA